MAAQKNSYNHSLKEIEDIIQKIEKGEPDVDELSALVKRAASLIMACRKQLKGTEDDLAQTLEDLE